MKEGRKGARPEPSLYRRAAGGDREALEQLVEYHRPWVEKIARSLSSRLPNLGCCEKQDLLNDAWEGFFKALRRYDPDRGTRFEAYAERVIRGAIIAGAARCLGLSEAARRAFPHLFDALEKLAKKGVLNPTLSQIQEELEKEGLHIPLHVITEILNCIRPVLFTQGEEDSGPGGIEEGRWDPPKEPTDGETVMEGWDRIKDRLGEERGQKFVVLAILHEGLGYEWEEIVHLLSSRSPSDWAKGWAIHIQRDWPHVLQYFPGLDDWEEVLCRFKCPPPHLSAANLRQWYFRRRLEVCHKSQ